MSQFASKKYQQFAQQFWEATYIPESFPRDIIQAISTLPNLLVVCLAELDMEKISDWLYNKNCGFTIEVVPKRLHGCLVIFRGRGIIFLNSSDPEAERRFTLAHELAHFLLEYQIPLQDAIRFFGENIREVLEGKRPPTLRERLDGILANVNLNPYVHLLERVDLNGFSRLYVWKVEDRADYLALELLVPFRKIYGQVKKNSKVKTFQLLQDHTCQLLIQKYGLPFSIAESYSGKIASRVQGGTSIWEEWGVR